MSDACNSIPSSVIQAVTTEAAPRPVGHYRQAVTCNGIVYISGQLGRRPDGTSTVGESFAVQARQSLANMLAIATAAGSSLERVVKVTAYIVGVENWPVFNAVFAEVFGSHYSARTVLSVAALSQGYLVEVDAIASLQLLSQQA